MIKNIVIYLLIVECLLAWGSDYLGNVIIDRQDQQISTLEREKLILQTDIATMSARLKLLEERRNQIGWLVLPYVKYDHKENQIYMASRMLDELGFDTAEVGMAVAAREAGFNDTSTHLNSNGTWDKGCWQINDVHGLSDTVRLDCKASTEWAVAKAKACGNSFRIWSATALLTKEGKI